VWGGRLACRERRAGVSPARDVHRAGVSPARDVRRAGVSPARPRESSEYMLKSKYDWAVMAMDREYFSLLVQQDRERQAKERLETMLIEGLESGPAEPMTARCLLGSASSGGFPERAPRRHRARLGENPDGSTRKNTAMMKVKLIVALSKKWYYWSGPAPSSATGIVDL